MSDVKYILEKLFDEKGLIFIREAEENGIDCFQLSYLAKENKIERIGHGIYDLKDEIVDEYVFLQNASERVIYSNHTALYFQGLSDRVPSQIHITVPQGYNSSRLKQRHENLVVHYVKKDVHELGKEKNKSLWGGDYSL